MEVGISENAHQRIKIAGGNRIVFVIVALRASHRQAQEPARSRIHSIVLHLWAESIEAQGPLHIFRDWEADRLQFEPSRKDRKACHPEWPESPSRDSEKDAG